MTENYINIFHSMNKAILKLKCRYEKLLLYIYIMVFSTIKSQSSMQLTMKQNSLQKVLL